MTQEVLKLALEALENYAWHEEACPQHPTYSEPKNYPKCTCGYDKAITAIKEALAQTEQDGECKYCTDGCPACDARKLPPQRTWVGLDHQDKKKFSSWLDHKTDDEVFTAIDDLLREMNT